MAGPGEGVAADQRRRRQVSVAGRHRAGQQDEAETGAGEMQVPGRGPAVLRQVARP
jgi:hypothetical protein